MLSFFEEAVVEERSKRHSALEGALRDILLQVLQLVNEKKDHIPPVLNTDVVAFPYEISIPRSLLWFLF